MVVNKLNLVLLMAFVFAQFTICHLQMLWQKSEITIDGNQYDCKRLSKWNTRKNVIYIPNYFFSLVVQSCEQRLCESTSKTLKGKKW